MHNKWMGNTDMDKSLGGGGSGCCSNTGGSTTIANSMYNVTASTIVNSKGVHIYYTV